MALWLVCGSFIVSAGAQRGEKEQRILFDRTDRDTGGFISEEELKAS